MKTHSFQAALWLCFLPAFHALASAPSSTDRLSTQAAEKAARHDIASGQMKIYLAGTRGVSEVGIESADRNLVARLPRDRSLPMGCTIPHASEAISFARTYNLAIIHALRLAKPTAIR